MKRINLSGLQKVLSEKELKNVLGGSGGDPFNWSPCHVHHVEGISSCREEDYPCKIIDDFDMVWWGSCKSDPYTGTPKMQCWCELD